MLRHLRWAVRLAILPVLALTLSGCLVPIGVAVIALSGGGGGGDVDVTQPDLVLSGTEAPVFATIVDVLDPETNEVAWWEMYWRQERRPWEEARQRVGNIAFAAPLSSSDGRALALA